MQTVCKQHARGVLSFVHIVRMEAATLFFQAFAQVGSSSQRDLPLKHPPQFPDTPFFPFSVSEAAEMPLTTRGHHPTSDFLSAQRLGKNIHNNITGTDWNTHVGRGEQERNNMFITLLYPAGTLPCHLFMQQVAL